LHPEFNILDTHNIASKFFENIKVLERVFFFLCALMFTTSILVIMISTIFEVNCHHKIIHILYLLGAKDSYISLHFQKRGRFFGLKGGVFGTLFGILSYLLFAYFTQNLIFESHFLVFFISTIVFLPISAIIVCDIISKLSSLRSIRKLQQVD
jgi:cell division protein FtsX